MDSFPHDEPGARLAVTRRYHGHFDPASPNWPRPRVVLLVTVPAIHPAGGHVDFLIDTGASKSVLHPADAFRIGFTPEQLTTPQPWPTETFTGIGGSVREYVFSARYGFVFMDQSTKTIEGQISVAPYSSANARLPSLLGWDVLRYFELTASWWNRQLCLDELPPGAEQLIGQVHVPR